MKTKKQHISQLRLLVEKRNRYRRVDWWLLSFISIIVIILVVTISLKHLSILTFPYKSASFKSGILIIWWPSIKTDRK